MPSRKLTVSSAAVLLCAAWIAPLAAKDQGFNGKWVLDQKSSQIETPIEDLREEIKQKGSKISIQSTFKEPENGIAPLVYLGIMATKLDLNADGQPAVNQIGPFMQTSKTMIDGNKMTTDWTATVNGAEVQGKWTRTLADDGKHMTLEVTESSTQGQKGHAVLALVRK